MYFSTVTIVGVGMLGASLGKAILKGGLAREVVGVGRDPAKLTTALQMGAITSSTTKLADGVRDTGLVLVCTPVATIAPTVLEIAKAVGPRTLITDVGSTKAALVAEIDRGLTGGVGAWAAFVGSHPLAGSEQSGPTAAKDDLFVGKTVVVTPTETSQPTAVSQITQFWQAIGAKVVSMSPAAHDQAVAAISHLPHLVASALAAGTGEDLLPLAATGFADTTRVAAGDVELWRQIFTDNRANLLAALATFENTLGSFRTALERGDDALLTRLLRQGKLHRDAVGS